YDYKYIETAAKVGIIRGTTGGRFMPDQPLTREQASLMLARAGEYKLNSDPQKSLSALQKKFTDANLIDSNSITAVEAVEKAKLMTGKPNVLQEGQTKPTYRFDPQASFTRAEAATVAMRLMQQMKKVPR